MIANQLAPILRGLFSQRQARSAAEFLELFQQLGEQDKSAILRFMQAFAEACTDERT